MNQSRTLLGLILIILGISIFLRIDVFRIIIPAFLLYLGYRLLTGQPSPTFDPVTTTESQQDRLNEAIIFSGLNRKVTTKDFQGGKLTLVFGGGKLDLSEADTQAETLDLEVNAVFGGLKLILPSNWQVNPETAAVFGGITQTAPPVHKKVKTTLNLKGAAIFGGIEITRPSAPEVAAK